ncbi:hypothetical protein [Limosilactobacillus portuensis]|uniref:hypothetical protein n=1 Tax=Limosilactobacillus portuensis TaxID=2742601 RepID=UPI0032654669
MGLFSSREDQIKKLDEKLSNFDDELAYKKIISKIQDSVDSGNIIGTDPSLVSAYIIHHDLQEIKKELQKLNEK